MKNIAREKVDKNLYTKSSIVDTTNAATLKAQCFEQILNYQNQLIANEKDLRSISTQLCGIKRFDNRISWLF